MGSGIAQVLATYGLSVVLHDLNEAVLTKAMTSMEKSINKLIEKGKVRETASAVLGRIKTSTVLDSFSKVELAIEAATENIELKKTIFKKLDAVLPPRSILGTNTSSISITELASVTTRSELDAELLRAFALEGEHGVDHVLDHAGACDLAVLGHMPDEDDGSTRLLGETNERLRRRAKRLSGRRELHAVAVALEELNAEPVLELPDVEAERRLRDVQVNGCATEVQFTREGHEVAQMAQIHNESPNLSRSKE